MEWYWIVLIIAYYGAGLYGWFLWTHKDCDFTRRDLIHGLTWAWMAGFLGLLVAALTYIDYSPDTSKTLWPRRK